jgi:hypothetical protein
VFSWFAVTNEQSFYLPNKAAQFASENIISGFTNETVDTTGIMLDKAITIMQL